MLTNFHPLWLPGDQYPFDDLLSAARTRTAAAAGDDVGVAKRVPWLLRVLASVSRNRPAASRDGNAICVICVIG